MFSSMALTEQIVLKLLQLYDSFVSITSRIFMTSLTPNTTGWYHVTSHDMLFEKCEIFNYLNFESHPQSMYRQQKLGHPSKYLLLEKQNQV